MELLALFDKDNKSIEGYIDRKHKLDVDEGKYFKIILVFIQNSEDKFLIQKTSINRGEEFATTGGHVSYGDSGLYTAIKELKEELGININSTELKLYSSILYTKAWCECYYTKLDIDKDSLNLQKDEVESIYWLSHNDIDNLIKKNQFRKSNIEPYNNLQKILKNKNL